MIARVQERLRNLLQQTASRLADAARLPAVIVRNTEVALGPVQPQSKPRERNHSDVVPLTSPPSPEEQINSTDMSASVETIAEQMLTLVDIVSSQEKDIRTLKEQCRRLEEHNQAIMVAFSAFFHVLAVGRVAKAGEVATLLQNISKIAEQEGRPKEAVAFLQNLSKMVPGQTEVGSGK
ncbi:hypothetical protein [Microvirga makkahensis]|uniref:Uncharacterized protein n=1 Tax=Microvirga makkahensis TaxID=1128670 RepID=A0A7X3MN03_9HYPH|nr:hypothetical protein [Microvirga makkahensis]MXQ10076.1 hypothetical protein [Microvirga makkahensis]